MNVVDPHLKGNWIWNVVRVSTYY